MLNLNPYKSPGADNLHPRILKDLSVSLSLPLSILYTESFKQQKLPQDWKDALITPLHKKDEKCLASNYRPISLTSVICKIMESIIKDDLMSYVCNNNIITSLQHGFLPGRSCQSNLLIMLNCLTEAIDKGIITDVIYSTHPLIRTRKGQTFLFELTNVRINRNWGKIGIFAKYKRNVFFPVYNIYFLFKKSLMDFNSFVKITAFSWIMEADNDTFWLRMFRNQLKIVRSTNSGLPDWNFCLLTLVPFFSASESFSLFLTQADKVFLGTLYLAATSFLLSLFSRSLSAWHF